MLQSGFDAACAFESIASERVIDALPRMDTVCCWCKRALRSQTAAASSMFGFVLCEGPVRKVEGARWTNADHFGILHRAMHEPGVAPDTLSIRGWFHLADAFRVVYRDDFERIP